MCSYNMTLNELCCAWSALPRLRVVDVCAGGWQKPKTRWRNGTEDTTPPADACWVAWGSPSCGVVAQRWEEEGAAQR